MKHPSTRQLKTAIPVSRDFLWVQNSGVGSSLRFWLHLLRSGSQDVRAAVVIWRLAWDWRTHFKVTCTGGKAVLPRHVDPFVLFECPHECSGRAHRSHLAFYDLDLEVTLCHFHRILLIKVSHQNSPTERKEVRLSFWKEENLRICRRIFFF